MAGRVIVFGSINMDIVATVERIAAPGETVQGLALEQFPGGKGGNQAFAAHRAGGRVDLIGRIGNDASGRALTVFYRNNGLTVSGISISETQPTGTALIQVERDSGQNSIVAVPGANAELSLSKPDALGLEAGDIVLSEFEVPATGIERLFAAAKAAGAVSMLNPTPVTESGRTAVGAADILVVNEVELAAYSGAAITETASDGEIEQAAGRLRRSADQTVIVTLGKRGVLAVAGDETITIPGRPVRAVDTTGAGDCFVGSLATALAKGAPLAQALHFANVAAGLSVQRKGAAPAMPTAEEIEAALA